MMHRRGNRFGWYILMKILEKDKKEEIEKFLLYNKPCWMLLLELLEKKAKKD